jgi:arylsulfatase A
MGTRFEHCYSQPICTPSRVKIMSGRYNIKNYVAFGVYPAKETTFAQLLKKAGYATCVAGKWQLGQEKNFPQELGFDESFLWQHTLKRVRTVNGQKNIDTPI